MADHHHAAGERAGVLRGLGDIVENLVTLEVNTIVKENMTARKMPPPRHALIDIAQDFCTTLERLDPGFQDIKITCGAETFDSIRMIATRRRDELLRLRDERGRLPPDDANAVTMLRRIMRNSDDIKRMLEGVKGRNPSAAEAYERAALIGKDAPQPLQLTPEELVLLRKIWDIGGEDIAMQTTVQLDGDVMTRLTPSLSDERHRRVIEIHRASVEISLNMWTMLITTAREFLAVVTGRTR